NYQSIEIPSFCTTIPNRPVTNDRPKFHIWRIPDNGIKPTSPHDSIELCNPVERLMALAPLVVCPRLARINAIFARQVAVELIRQLSQLATKPLLGRGELSGIHAVIGLHLVEHLELAF